MREEEDRIPFLGRFSSVLRKREKGGGLKGFACGWRGELEEEEDEDWKMSGGRARLGEKGPRGGRGEGKERPFVRSPMFQLLDGEKGRRRRRRRAVRRSWEGRGRIYVVRRVLNIIEGERGLRLREVVLAQKVVV